MSFSFYAYFFWCFYHFMHSSCLCLRGKLYDLGAKSCNKDVKAVEISWGAPNSRTDLS